MNGMNAFPSKKRLAVWAILVVCILLGASFLLNKKTEDGVAWVVGVSFSDLADPWQQQLYLDLQESAKGLDATLLTYDAAGSVEAQGHNLQDMRVRRIQGLIIVPVQDQSLEAELKGFQEKSIPVVLLQSRVEGFTADCFVYSDNRLAGEIAGSYISRALEGRGILMEIAGDPGDPVSADRKAGFRKKVALFPELKREYLVPGHYSGSFTEKALAENGLLEATPVPDAVFAHTDLMALGAAKAFREAGLKPIVVGINGLPGATQGMDLVEKGILSATVSYPTGGAIAIETLFKKLQNQPVPKEIQIQPVLHTGILSE